ncbi:MAG: hypothetical protein LBI03_07545 [Clostridiales bacterium]|jgi:hypothetical protein|nr:hypothetical protein [Clostridiales bacterium]
MSEITVQEMATLLRDIAYADNLSHHLRWSLSVIHPKTNEGDVGYSGGIWHERNPKNNMKNSKNISVSFSFSEIKGIHQFKFWKDSCEIRFNCVRKGGKITIENFKNLMIKEFEIEELYHHD